MLKSAINCDTEAIHGTPHYDFMVSHVTSSESVIRDINKWTPSLSNIITQMSFIRWCLSAHQCVNVPNVYLNAGVGLD